MRDLKKRMNEGKLNNIHRKSNNDSNIKKLLKN